MVNKKSGDSLILQKLLEKLEIELGSKEAVWRDILMEKSQTDGLDWFEYWAVNKFYLPILLQYSNKFHTFRYQGDQENSMFMMSKVLNVEIIHHDEPISKKLDKKFREGKR